MRRVIIESPFAGAVARNQNYARLCCAHALALGDAPFASHLLYTQDGILDDTIEDERELGITAGLIWGAVAETSCVYIDLGVSGGMRRGIADARYCHRPVEIRSIASPLTLIWGQEPIDEALAKAPSVFGDGDALTYFALQARIVKEMAESAMAIPPFPLQTRSMLLRHKILQGQMA